ncbi:hypothetical protein V1264_024862 [Littorina saxatilis]|uniref:Uncharacterized protein n=1 Tax=Littorina saxatilis TaxID=31220 RepID=A0AAN9AMP2_9CAEN
MAYTSKLVVCPDCGIQPVRGVERARDVLKNLTAVQGFLHLRTADNWGGDIAQLVARWICIQLAAVSVSSIPGSAEIYFRVNFVCRLSSVSELPPVYTTLGVHVKDPTSFLAKLLWHS